MEKAVINPPNTQETDEMYRYNESQVSKKSNYIVTILGTFSRSWKSRYFDKRWERAC